MKFLKTIAAGLVLCGLSAFILHADSFTVPTAVLPLVTATNLPATVATTVTTNAVSYVSIARDTGLSMYWLFNTSSGTSNAVVYLYPTNDGTNYATTAWVTNTATARGTTNTSQIWNWSPAQLRDITGFQIGIYNQNAGTLTNKGIQFLKQ